MKFVKAGVLWQSAKKDKNGKPFMSGTIDEDIALTKKQKVFVFMTDPTRRGPKSPMATIVVGVEGEAYVAPVEEEPVAEPMPDPLPDDSGEPIPF
jgi:hypothetical protein